MKYLLDTNVLSEAVKTAPDKSVMKMLERHQHEIVTAAPVGMSFNLVVSAFRSHANVKL
jgi:predicted nucleic acid-binding protein